MCDRYEAWSKANEAKKSAMRAMNRAMDAMHRQHLQRFMPELGELEAYTDIWGLLQKGVAYHHGGMLPILREFVELCFQQKLIKLVFATETLAVGVNMPARTVVFSQLDKPDDGDRPGHRSLRPDEFWQMAGRAGRRGMDELGYVIYAPTLSVAGLRNMSSAQDLRGMLSGAMPAAESQLLIDPPFVLRHINQGYGSEVLLKTLLADQQQRQIEHLQEELGAMAGGSSTGEELVKAATRYAEVESKLAGDGVMRVSQKQRKSLEKEKAALKEAFGEDLDRIGASVAKKQDLEKQISGMSHALAGQWDEKLGWLRDMGMLDKDDGLTARGKACAAFADGQPLIIGTIISDAWLQTLTLPEVCSFICLFLKESRIKEVEKHDQPPEKYSAALSAVVDATYGLAYHLGVELDHNLSLVMLDWCTHKDIKRVARWVDPSMLGTFVKAHIYQG